VYKRQDLAILAQGDLVTLSRPGGLILSPPSAELETGATQANAPQSAQHPGLILTEWADAGEGGFTTRYRALQDAAALEAQSAGDDPRAPAEARFAFARFLIGSGLSYEAIGVLNAIVAKQPNMIIEPVAPNDSETGRRRATVSAGPRPGRTPTAVPSRTPSSAKPRLAGCAAMSRPSKRSANVSMIVGILSFGQRPLAQA